MCLYVTFSGQYLKLYMYVSQSVMGHTNSLVKIKPCTSFSRAKGRFLLQKSWDEVEVVRQNLNFLLPRSAQKRQLSCSGDHVAGLSRRIKIQVMYTLALAHDFPISSSFPQFSGSTVRGRKQNSLSHTRVTLWSDTRDPRGYSCMFSERLRLPTS